MTVLMSWDTAQRTGLAGNSLMKRVTREVFRAGGKVGLSEKHTKVAAIVLGVLALPLAPAVIPAAWPVVGGAYLMSKQRDENEVEFAKIKAAEAAYAAGAAEDEVALIQEQVEHAVRVRALRRSLRDNVRMMGPWVQFAARTGVDLSYEYAEIEDLAVAGEEVEDVPTLEAYVELSFAAADQIRAAVQGG